MFHCSCVVSWVFIISEAIEFADVIVQRFIQVPHKHRYTYNSPIYIYIEIIPISDYLKSNKSRERLYFSTCNI